MAKSSSLKWCAFFLNLIVSISGLILLILAARCLFDPEIYPVVVQADVNYTYLYCVMLFGALVTIFGFVGFAGVIAESSCLLTTFFSLILMIVVGQIAFGVVVYKNRIAFSDTVKQSISIAITGKQPDKTELFREVEKSMKCCGSYSYQSWSLSAENQAHLASIGSDLIGQGVFFVPSSCCVDPRSQQCNAISATGVRKDAIVAPEEYHNKGCTEKIANAVTQYTYFALVYGAIFAFVELVAAFVTLGLMMMVRRSAGLGGDSQFSRSQCSVCSARSTHSIASGKSLSRLPLDVERPLAPETVSTQID